MKPETVSELRPSRVDATAKEQLLSRVVQEHRGFEAAARDVESFGGTNAAFDLDAIVMRACEEFLIHGQLEKEILYPALRASIPQQLLVDEASVEHDSIRALVDELRSFGPGAALFMPTFTVLSKLVSLHVDNEEHRLLELAEGARIDWDGLLRQWIDRRAELMGEHGLTAPGTDTERRPLLTGGSL